MKYVRDSTTNDPVLHSEHVASLRGQSTVTLWRSVKDGRFPRAMRVGRRVGWKRSTVERWLREQEEKLRNEHQRIREQLSRMCDHEGEPGET